MVAALIFVISVVTLLQFALFYWRAMVAGIAAEPISDRFRAAADITGERVAAEDFAKFVSLYKLCPKLEENGRGVAFVRFHYHAVAALRKLLGSSFPALSAWASNEMATCSQYVAVIVDQRLAHVHDHMAQMRSF